jgi:hypothetical protein
MAVVTLAPRSVPPYPTASAAQVFAMQHQIRCAYPGYRSHGVFCEDTASQPAGTKVRLRLTHQEENFEAIGTLVYTSTSLGRGVAFTNIAPDDLANPDRWSVEPECEC